MNQATNKRLRDSDTLDGMLSKRIKLNDDLKLLEELHKTKVHTLGPDHPESLTVLYQIGAFLSKRHKYAEGLATLQEVFNKQNNVLGPTHRETLNTLENMAELLSALQRHSESTAINREIRRIKETLYETEIQKNLGPDHPDLATQILSAYRLLHVRQYDEAFKSFTQVYDIQRNSTYFGPEHPQTLETQFNIATILEKQGKHAAALEVFTALLEINKKSKLTSPNVFTAILDHIASIYALQGKLTEAMNVYEELYEVELQLNKRSDHPALWTILKSKATILVRQQKYTQALEVFRNVYEKQVIVLGKNHCDTLNTKKYFQHLENVMSENRTHRNNCERLSKLSIPD